MKTNSISVTTSKQCMLALHLRGKFGAKYEGFLGTFVFTEV